MKSTGINSYISGAIASWALWLVSAPVFSQVPVPGQGNAQAPVQASTSGNYMPDKSGAPSGISAQAPTPAAVPLPGNNPQNQAPGSFRKLTYDQLPLTPYDAQDRLVDLSNALGNVRPNDIQQSILELCEWLQEMADYHYKLTQTFSKSEATKVQADSERQLQRQFSSLKNQAQLLKAELFIRQHRLPEALTPLVEIIVQEPRTATGQRAYQRLKEIGFSQDSVANNQENSAKATPSVGSQQPGSNSATKPQGKAL